MLHAKLDGGWCRLRLGETVRDQVGRQRATRARRPRGHGGRLHGPGEGRDRVRGTDGAAAAGE